MSVTPTTHEYTTPAFAAHIEEHQTAASVPGDIIHLQAGVGESIARLDIRCRGAFITRLTLLDSQQRPVDLLYSEPDVRRGKLAASHAMLPVGPTTEVGGQHGFPRWADYRPLLVENGDRLHASASLGAHTGDAPIDFMRNHALGLSTAQVLSHLYNRGDAPIATSMGEHFYFAKPEAAGVHDININDEPIDKLTEPGVADAIEQGKAYFWPGYKGSALVQMPDGPPIHINSGIIGRVKNAGQVPGGALLWQRAAPEGQKGQPYLCFEPVYGYTESRGHVDNKQLVIPRAGFVAMSTTISI